MPGYTLPDFLSEIKALRSLTVAGTSKVSIAGVERALRPLTQLTQLVLRRVHAIPQALAGLSSSTSALQSAPLGRLPKTCSCPAAPGWPTCASWWRPQRW